VCVNKLPTVISEKQAEVKRGSWFSPCQSQDSSSSSCPLQPLQPRPSWCLFSWGHSWRLPSSSVVVDKASSSNPRFPLENLSRDPMMIHMWKMSKPVKLNLKLVNYEWNGYRMTINCSSHGQVQLLLVHAPSIPPDQHPGMLYQLRFMIQQSHWEPLGRCWNHFCSDWQMRILGHGIRIAACGFVMFVKGHLKCLLFLLLCQWCHTSACHVYQIVKLEIRTANILDANSHRLISLTSSVTMTLVHHILRLLGH